MYIQRSTKILGLFSLLVFLFCSFGNSGKEKDSNPIINKEYSHWADSAYLFIHVNDSISLSYYLKAFAEESPRNLVHIYTAAVLASRLQQKELAFSLLSLAVERGYSSYDHMKKNTSFSILDKSLFEEYLEKVRQRDSLLWELSRGLDSIFALDQNIREAYEIAIQYHGTGQQVTDPEILLDSMVIIDNKNLDYVNSFMDRYGFLGRSLKTDNSRDALFALYLHAPVEEMERRLDLFREAVKSGELPLSQYPYFEDRILAIKKGVQKYGTQFYLQDGEVVMVPLIDSLNVNMYRDELGMGTLEDYMNMMKGETFSVEFENCKIKSYK